MFEVLSQDEFICKTPSIVSSRKRDAPLLSFGFFSHIRLVEKPEEGAFLQGEAMKSESLSDAAIRSEAPQQH